MEDLPPVVDNPPDQIEAKMSLGARLLNVFAAPGEVFEQIRDRAVSPSNWVAPALLLLAVGWLGSLLVFGQPSIMQQIKQMSDQSLDKQIQSGKLSQQQADQARPVVQKVTIGITYAAAYGMPVFAGFAVPFIYGLILWLVGNKALGGNFPYMKAVELVGLAGMIDVLGSVLRVLLILVMDNPFASPSLALFVKQFDPQNPVHGFLGLFNITALWCLTVRAVGLARISKSSFAKAAMWVFGIWAAWGALITGFGFAARALSPK
jgi:hypothetical protein